MEPAIENSTQVPRDCFKPSIKFTVSTYAGLESKYLIIKDGTHLYCE